MTPVFSYQFIPPGHCCAAWVSPGSSVWLTSDAAKLDAVGRLWLPFKLQVILLYLQVPSTDLLPCYYARIQVTRADSSGRQEEYSSMAAPTPEGRLRRVAQVVQATKLDVSDYLAAMMEDRLAVPGVV